MLAHRMDLDHVLHDMTLIGFGALLAWTLTGAVGTVAGYLTIQPQPAMRFLLAILVLVFARHGYWRLRRARWAAHPEVAGFTMEVWETPRSNEPDPASHHDADVTEPPHPQG